MQLTPANTTPIVGPNRTLIALIRTQAKQTRAATDYRSRSPTSETLAHTRLDSWPQDGSQERSRVMPTTPSGRTRWSRKTDRLADPHRPALWALPELSFREHARHRRPRTAAASPSGLTAAVETVIRQAIRITAQSGNTPKNPSPIPSDRRLRSRPTLELADIEPAPGSPTT